jgi:hypothetical protein
MHKFQKILTAILIAANISGFCPANAEDMSLPHTITATMYNQDATEYGITYRSLDKYEKPQVQFAKKTAGKDVFKNPLVFDATIDNHGSLEKDHIYKAVVSGLEYDTEYIFRVGDAKRNIWSETCSFRTAPQQDEKVVFTFLYVTDSQKAPKRFGQVLGKAFSMYPEIRFILHTGDMVENGLVEDEWKAMLHDNRRYTAHTLINSISGNYHEDNGAELYIHFHKKLPENQSVEKGYFYSFDYANAHFVMLDITDVDNNFNLSEKQIKWLEKDLEGTDKIWKIVGLHWPLYSTGPHSNYSIEWFDSLRKQLEPIFTKYNVELVLQGHDHVYSRSKSILDGRVYVNRIYVEKKYENRNYLSVVNQKGTTYLTGGSSGTKFYSCQVPERFDGYFEVCNNLYNSMFTVITVSEKELLVRAYIYDHENDKAILHDIFGFAKSYANLQTMAQVREVNNHQKSFVGIAIVSSAVLMILFKRIRMILKDK